MSHHEEFCHGCERAIGIDRSTLHCVKCGSHHVLCLQCLFDPDVHSFVPPPGTTPMGGYWAKCPIPILVLRRRSDGKGGS